jgi:small conductance mechanosensitive channel
MNTWINWIKATAPGVAADIVYAIVIVIAGMILSHVAAKIVARLLARGKLKDEKMLTGLARKSTRAIILVFALMIALDKVGISIAPLIASLGVGGLVLGFAFRDTLSNFASGLLILIYRPFRIDDVVDVGGTMGQVLDLTIVNTKLKDFAGPEIYLPNSQVWGSKIINYSRAQYRRAIFNVGISYDDDQAKAWDVLQKLINEEKRILPDPAPFIRLSELADSSVNFQMFVHTRPEDYGSLLNDFYAGAKAALESAGFSIPFPQTDVHLYREDKG